MTDEGTIIYHLLCGSKIVESFQTLAAAKRYAQGIVGHVVAVWDNQGSYYGMWRPKEGWVH